MSQIIAIGHALDGPGFERFLADVFGLHGCTVVQLGGSGDQGVDLIVTTAAGNRVAVQAKCYSSSLGNTPIQEVFLGMRIHQCNVCAVVTNSTFTRGGVQAAEAAGCHLVDGEQLRALIVHGPQHLGWWLPPTVMATADRHVGLHERDRAALLCSLCDSERITRCRDGGR